MRFVFSAFAFTLLLLVAGCPSVSSELQAAPGEDDAEDPKADPTAPGQIACTADTDCVAVASTCCGCPSYATHADDPSAAACDEVECPTPDSCSNTYASCRDGACMLACAPVTCSNSCAEGYARDVNGCLTCECAAPPSDGCREDNECVRIAADCCGCSRGGIDTAVRAGTEGAYGDMLECGSDSQCPGVNTCTPGDAPYCVQGACALVQPLPTGACGRSDLPACATCMVNANDQADMHGVGVCQTP